MVGWKWLSILHNIHETLSQQKMRKGWRIKVLSVQFSAVTTVSKAAYAELAPPLLPCVYTLYPTLARILMLGANNQHFILWNVLILICQKTGHFNYRCVPLNYADVWKQNCSFIYVAPGSDRTADASIWDSFWGNNRWNLQHWTQQ